MKAYELMNELSKLPAGAEIYFNHTITEKEFENIEATEEGSGEKTKRIMVGIDAIYEGLGCAYLYGKIIR